MNIPRLKRGRPKAGPFTESAKRHRIAGDLASTRERARDAARKAKVQRVSKEEVQDEKAGRKLRKELGEGDKMSLDAVAEIATPWIAQQEKLSPRKAEDMKRKLRDDLKRRGRPS